MKKINAIDLDKTLIPFDSFRTLIILFLLRKKFLTLVAFLTLMRLMRLLDNGEFKHRALKIIRKDKHYNGLIQKLVIKITEALKPEILRLIEQETDKDTINVLVSASPIDYVRLVAQNLGWPYLASEFKNNIFFHCHEIKKKELVQIHYPNHEFIYNFAISDSLSDMPLLKMFKKYELISA